MTIPRPALVAVTAVAVVAGGAFTVDAVSASRIESDLSAQLTPDTPGTGPASVQIGGPFSRWSEPDTLSSVAVRIERVERPGLGPVAVEAVATDVRIPADRTDPPDPAEDLTAAAVTTAVQITGESLGPPLGMRDVLVAAADDPSLAGGTENRARVSGTLGESDIRVSAIVDLVVDADGAHLVPVTAATGPGGIPDQDTELALRSTALTLAPDVLPLGATVELLTVKGGTITATGTGAPGTALDDLARVAN